MGNSQPKPDKEGGMNSQQVDLEEDDEEQDDLEAFIAERAKTDPMFPARVEAGVRVRLLLIALEARRKERGISKKEMAKCLGMKRAAFERMVRGGMETKLSQLTGFALALGMQIAWQLEDAKVPV
jgi:hypothetical protein